MTSRVRTLVAYVEDRPGVLSRVSALFRRRGYNIESLTVGTTDQRGVSRMTVVVNADDDTFQRVVANLYKLVNVLKVDELEGGAVVTDLALIKVKVQREDRTQVLQLVDVFRARVVDVSPEALIVEITGTKRKIDGFVEVLRPFGIAEMVRAGAIAMTRGARETGAQDTHEEQQTWQQFSTTKTQTSA